MKFSPARYPRIAEARTSSFAWPAAASAPRPTSRPRCQRVSALLVARFDRTPDGRRIPQEDACQIGQAPYPASKYRLKTETAIKRTVPRLRDGGGSAAATLELLQTVSFSWLIGNGDLHGKNLSIYAPETFAAHPSYDLAVRSRMRSWRDPMAMMLYGRNNRLTHTHIVESGERLGLRHGRSPGCSTHSPRPPPWIGRCAEISFDDRTTAHLETTCANAEASLLDDTLPRRRLRPANRLSRYPIRGTQFESRHGSVGRGAVLILSRSPTAGLNRCPFIRCPFI